MSSLIYKVKIYIHNYRSAYNATRYKMIGTWSKKKTSYFLLYTNLSLEFATELFRNGLTNLYKFFLCHQIFMY